MTSLFNIDVFAAVDAPAIGLKGSSSPPPVFALPL